MDGKSISEINGAKALLEQKIEAEPDPAEKAAMQEKLSEIQSYLNKSKNVHGRPRNMQDNDRPRLAQVSQQRG